MPWSVIVESVGEAERALCRGQTQLPVIVRPAFTLGGARRGSGGDRDRASPGRLRGARREPDQPGPGRGVGARLGRVRARGDARPKRQRRRHLLDRERRPDGRPHRRQRHGRSGADAHRSPLPGASRPGAASDPRRRRRDRRLEHPVRRRPGERRGRRDRDEPAGVAISALASKATGFPIAKIAARLAVGYALEEIPNDITRATPASFEPTIDYVVIKVPRFAFEKFPGAEGRLSTHMK